MGTQETQKVDHAEQQAQGTMEHIREAMAALGAAEASDVGTAEYEGDTLTAEDIRERLEEWPLSVLIRNGWHPPGAPHDADTSEYEILLSTGGPAVRIRGELAQHHSPDKAEIEYQDWGTPWTALWIPQEDEDALLAFACIFYYGE